MSEDSIAVVKRAYGLAGGGREAARSPRALIEDLFDPHVVIEENAAFPDADSYRGYEGLARWWSSFFEVYDEVQIEPRDFLVAGDCVVVEVSQRLRSKAGVLLEPDMTHVWRLRGGRIVHVTGYHDRAEALRAVGLAP
jgi:ketosteroid isomerase-like protein